VIGLSVLQRRLDMKINRRKFIQAAGGAALGSVVQAHPSLSALQETAEPPPRPGRVAVFIDPSFPTGEIAAVNKEAFQKGLEGFEVVFLDAQGLRQNLKASEHDVFINPNGSLFPKSAFNAIDQFLRSGGSWINLGGVPLSIPVTKNGTGWREETRQTAFHKKLGITQAFPVAARSINSYRTNELLAGTEEFLKAFTAEEIYELYVRLTSTNDFPAESGTAGSRDAVLHPLVSGVDAKGRSIAAPFIVIDRLQGEFAGGRWLFANFRGTVSAKAVRALVEMAAQGAIEFRSRPSYACYRAGELPAFTIQLHRPQGNVESLIQSNAEIEVLDERGSPIDSSSISLEGKGAVASGSGAMSARGRENLAAGLYEVNVQLKVKSVAAGSPISLRTRTGFWILDEDLLKSGQALTLEKDYFLKGAQPYPITGTTYMASDAHRKFLFEPNAFIWDKDFKAMKEAGINLVRTGIWTGWRNFMLEVGAPNEAVLRAMDAFVLTARKHDIPLLFTFFAFLPETWGGVNAYLDPRAVGAQKEFVRAFVERYRSVKDIAWDLINEPSFCSPQQLWSCRPNYDAYESAAWKTWLAAKYPAASEEEHVARLQEIYGTADDPAELPKLQDFDDANILGDRHPTKVIDYRLFSQEMFARWVKEISEVIRGSGNAQQLVTVGQDEAGVSGSPNPQFFAAAVDFTSIHNWWMNDALVWNSVMSKVPGKPNLVEETGVMFYEKMDGGAWRTEEEVRNLLERKLAIATGTGSAGFVEWIWNANPYMTSENEAAIGLLRADGTAKPEVDPVEAFAKFLSSNRASMKGRRSEDVVMVIPHSQMFSTRNFATAATQNCVRVMYCHCRVPVSAVSEYSLGALHAAPQLVVIPSPRVLNQKAWETMMSMVAKGSTLLITGFFDSDEHWLRAPRSKDLGVKAFAKPVMPDEPLSIDGITYRLSYRGEKMHRVEKAVTGQRGVPTVVTLRHGQGEVIWSPLPVEVSDVLEPVGALYKFALQRARVVPTFLLEEKNPSILILASVFDETTLYAFVSECDLDAEVNLLDKETSASIRIVVPAQRSRLVFLDRKDGRVIARM
jgi:hypothetical protein